MKRRAVSYCGGRIRKERIVSQAGAGAVTSLQPPSPLPSFADSDDNVTKPDHTSMDKLDVVEVDVK